MRIPPSRRTTRSSSPPRAAAASPCRPWHRPLAAAAGSRRRGAARGGASGPRGAGRRRRRPTTATTARCAMRPAAAAVWSHCRRHRRRRRRRAAAAAAARSQHWQTAATGFGRRRRMHQRADQHQPFGHIAVWTRPAAPRAPTQAAKCLVSPSGRCLKREARDLRSCGASNTCSATCTGRPPPTPPGAVGARHARGGRSHVAVNLAG